MIDLIDRKRLLWALEANIVGGVYCKVNGKLFKAMEVNGVLETIRNAPTVEAEPIRHGKWVKYYGYEDRYYCSNCQDIWRSERIKCLKYCPTCGAKVDEVEE